MQESRENHDQEVGYRAPESASSTGRSGTSRDEFPSTEQARQAAGDNTIHYNHATDASDINDSAGTGPTIPGQFGTQPATGNMGAGSTAGTAQNDRTPFRDTNASSAGMPPDRAGSYPGPGTASDRGTGTVGSTPFGTGIADTGLETSSGLDERNTSNTNTASYNAADLSSPLSGSGVTGSGTPGRDNEFNELGTDGMDLSPRDSTGGSR
ncbi:MAG: hypothetical protein JWP00_916 [Chloroflexi bacterium]|jgi:hypothetical protein|nr:hypothetical protein [Chloroflexota bacterium]